MTFVQAAKDPIAAQVKKRNEKKMYRRAQKGLPYIFKIFIQSTYLQPQLVSGILS